MRPDEVFTIRAENMHLDERYLFNPFDKTRFARRNVPLTERVIEVMRNRMGKAKGA